MLHPVRCALLADDLTGACDAAVPFKLRGARSVVCLNGADRLPYDVIAVSTESRDLDACAARLRVREAASQLAPFDPTIVFKKIDSTLRGNVGIEIAAALEAFDCDFAIITPAFPRMRRLVQSGHLCVEGDDAWQPIDLVERLHERGLGDCVHISPQSIAAAIERGERFLSLEAVCDDDLEAIAAETIHFGRRVLYAGSAGLAGAVAKLSFCNDERAGSHKPSSLPCVFCIGSDHPVTLAQVAAIAKERPTHCFQASSTPPRTLADCLQTGHHAILWITRGEELREILESAGNFASALLLSGGDTASLVCSALGVEAIELEGEIVTGLPWGRLQAGSLSGLAVATKSGGFGATDALIKVADFFTCHKN